MSIFNKLKSFVKSKTYKNTGSTPSQITVKEDIASSYVLELSPWRVGERIEGRFEIHDVASRKLPLTNVGGRIKYR